MGAETIGVILAAVGSLIGVVVGYYVKAATRLRKTDAEIALARDQAATDRAVAEETRVVRALTEHVDRLTAEIDHLRRQQDRDRDECEERWEQERARADALKAEVDRMLREHARLQVWVEYLQDLLRQKKVSFREYTPGVESGEHTPLPPDRSRGAGS